MLYESRKQTRLQLNSVSEDQEYREGLFLKISKTFLGNAGGSTRMRMSWFNSLLHRYLSCDDLVWNIEKLTAKLFTTLRNCIEHVERIMLHDLTRRKQRSTTVEENLNIYRAIGIGNIWKNIYTKKNNHVTEIG